MQNIAKAVRTSFSHEIISCLHMLLCCVSIMCISAISSMRKQEGQLPGNRCRKSNSVTSQSHMLPLIQNSLGNPAHFCLGIQDESFT